MPDIFLFSYTSFDDASQPFLEWQQDGEVGRVPAFGQNLALEFDFSKKFCTGWVDFVNHCSQACPEQATVETKYENCVKCRNRTGFNPAFYHAAEVSERQQQINQQPHYLYLAYFAPGAVKVGISQEARGLRRLLEQGARLALKLETFGSALVARQYEAKIAGLDGIIETVPASKKFELIKQPFGRATGERMLRETLAKIEETLGVTFPKAELIVCENYFQTAGVDLTKAVLMKDQNQLVGRVRSVVGSVVITEYDGELLAYNLKKYLGYRARKSTEPVELELPTEQLALF